MKKVLMSILLVVMFIIYVPFGLISRGLINSISSFTEMMIDLWSTPRDRLFWTETGRKEWLNS